MNIGLLETFHRDDVLFVQKALARGANINVKDEEVSFETIAGAGDTAISGIKIAGQDGLVACVYNFDATHFEYPWGTAIDLILTRENHV